MHLAYVPWPHRISVDKLLVVRMEQALVPTIHDRLHAGWVGQTKYTPSRYSDVSIYSLALNLTDISKVLDMRCASKPRQEQVCSDRTTQRMGEQENRRATYDGSYRGAHTIAILSGSIN